MRIFIIKLLSDMLFVIRINERWEMENKLKAIITTDKQTKNGQTKKNRIVLVFCDINLEIIIRKRKSKWSQVIHTRIIISLCRFLTRTEHTSSMESIITLISCFPSLVIYDTTKCVCDSLIDIKRTLINLLFIFECNYFVCNLFCDKIFIFCTRFLHIYCFSIEYSSI